MAAKSDASPCGGAEKPRIAQLRSDLPRATMDYSVLIVDDEDDLRSAICFDFMREGFGVLSAPSGAAAIEVIKACRIDLVISDVQMPHGDGLYLLDQIRSSPNAIPLIFISGFTGVSESECISRGALRVFPKPFDRKLLMKTVFEILGLNAEKTD